MSILAEYSISTIGVLDNIENKHNLYRGEDCMKKFYTSFRGHATNVTVNKSRSKIIP